MPVLARCLPPSQGSTVTGSTSHLSFSGDTSFLVTKEASEHDDLADADDKQEEGLPYGPVGDSVLEVFCPDAVLGLPKSVPCLRLHNHLQDLMDRHAGRFHLKTSYMVTFARPVGGWTHSSSASSRKIIPA